MNQPKGAHTRVDLGDVEAAMRDVGGTHCCNLRFELVPPERRDTPVLFWVKLVAEPRLVGRRTIRTPLAVSSRWPCVDAAYLEALMLRLVYLADKKLEDHGHCPAEQAEFPWAKAD